MDGNTGNLVVFDVDGTLLSDTHRIKKSTLEAIKELKRRKIPYTLATGRSYHFCRSLAHKLEVASPIITCNGALIQDALSGDILHKGLLPKKAARQVLEDLSGIYEQVNMFLTFSETLIIPATNRTILKNRPSFPIQVVDNLQKQHVDDLVKITIQFFDMKLLSLTLESLKKKNEHYISVTQSDDRSIDITSLHSNKGESVKKLGRLMNADTIYAFGNQNNDLEMLKIATVGIAMNNAVDSLKNLADYVTLSNNEDGIFNALREFLLIK